MGNLSYIDLFKLWEPFTYWMSIKIINHVSGYHLQTLRTHIYIFEGESRPKLSFSVVHEYHQVSLQFKDFRYVHCLYLYKSEHVYQKYDILQVY